MNLLCLRFNQSGATGQLYAWNFRFIGILSYMPSLDRRQMACVLFLWTEVLSVGFCLSDMRKKINHDNIELPNLYMYSVYGVTTVGYS